MEIPEPFRRRMEQIHGAAGRSWVDTIPSVLADLAERWSVVVEPPLPELSYNFVAPAVDTDGRRWILKLVTGDWEGDREAIALAAYAGRGAARLERHDPSVRAMLLERVEPGEDLRKCADHEAVLIVAGVLEQLWQAPPVDGLAELAEWTQSLDRFAYDPGPLPRAAIERAHGLRRDLLGDPPDRVVVHGDLHHAHVLRSERRGWLAIDPKGLVGEKAFDIPFFLLNPGPVSRETTRRRIDAFVERLGLARERVVAWAFVQAVLSACWTVEDHGEGWEGGIRFAESLEL